MTSKSLGEWMMLFGAITLTLFALKHEPVQLKVAITALLCIVYFIINVRNDLKELNEK
ncbi:MAG: hypothetical protein ACPGWR_20020 [Ardenticatenaceae bacterium]